MGEWGLSIVGPLISAFIDIFLLSQFFEANYHRRYCRGKWSYRFLVFAIVLVVASVNYYQVIYYNFAVSILICILFGFILYYDEQLGRIHTFLRALLIFIAYCLLELVGYFLLRLAVDKMHMVVVSEQVYNFLNLTVTKILEIIFYYAWLKNVLGRERLRRLSYHYYLVYAILVMMSISSTFVVLSAVVHIKSRWENILMIVNLITIVAANLYMLKLLDSFSEKEALKVQLGIFEQQGKLQEKYYGALNDRYNQSLKVLHDVDKHIYVIESLYQKGDSLEAMEYTRDISKMLLPLVPKKYSDHNILNIILNDKAEIAARKNIEFRCVMEDIDYGFMRNSDITTIFSNLLDNAIEACMKKENGRYITIKTGNHQDMIMIRIANSIGEKPVWRDGRPMSQKGERHGIGLKNVEKVVTEYNGSVDFEMNEQEFACSIILNKTV